MVPSGEGTSNEGGNFMSQKVKGAGKPSSKVLTPRNVIGYALGDTGGVLAFGVISAFLNMYYTDVLGITTGKLVILFLVARIWDAVNDPMMGAFLDSRKPTRWGRFRPYIYFGSFPMILSLILCFLPLPAWKENQYLVYAYITYIFYGMAYTFVNIPYGSMATVMTEDTGERSVLSIARTFGAGIGQAVGSVILPLCVYEVADNGAKVLSGSKLFTAVLFIACAMLVVYFLNFRLTKEQNIEVKKEEKRDGLLKTFGSLFKNRAFLSLSLASMILIMANMYGQTVNGYLFKNYFGTPKLQSMIMIANYLPLVILMPFTTKLIKKFGKKELCSIGAYIAAAAYLAGLIVHTTNPYVFLVILFASGFGIAFFTLEVWAMVSDAIDYQEKLTGHREEGTSYAVYSFFRKVGQTLAGVGANAALGFVGYQVGTTAIIQDEAVTNGIYVIATLIPFIVYLVQGLLLHLAYPLSRDRVEELHAELAVRRAE